MYLNATSQRESLRVEFFTYREIEESVKCACSLKNDRIEERLFFFSFDSREDILNLDEFCYFSFVFGEVRKMKRIVVCLNIIKKK